VTGEEWIRIRMRGVKKRKGEEKRERRGKRKERRKGRGGKKEKGGEKKGKKCKQGQFGLFTISIELVKLLCQTFFKTAPTPPEKPLH
jgi:hypothetical protein